MTSSHPTTSDSLHIRIARDNDIPTILAVIKAAFAEHRGKIDPPSSAVPTFLKMRKAVAT